MKEKANCYTDSRHKQLTQKLPRLFAFDLFYFVIHCDFGVVDMVATTTADLSGKTKRRRLRIKMAKFEETPPEVRTPENVEMRSASPLPTEGSSSSEAGHSNPGPRTPVSVAGKRGLATTPNVYCHNYCTAPVSMTYFTGGRNLQSSIGINVAPGGGIGGNDEDEEEEEEVEQRQVVPIGMFRLEDVTLELHHHLGLDGKLGLCPGNHGITNIKKLIKKVTEHWRIEERGFGEGYKWIYENVGSN